MKLLPDLTRDYDWLEPMKGCPQDPVFHAEGDVYVHVRKVCEALTSLEDWRVLPEDERNILLTAALLHDVAKPACTRVEEGRITSRGHSQRGAIMARRILWEHGADFKAREQVCALVRFHQAPFYLIEREDSVRFAYLISQSARCDLLTILARADALGRECQDQSELLTRIALFHEFCIEQNCLTEPRAFASPQSRFEYFRTENRDPHYHVHDETKCEVVLMSGLPGSGKDTWIREHMPDASQISLDQIRDDLAVAPSGNQGAVIQEAKERARVLLRQNKGFVWNATNLTRDVRSQLIDLFANYQARVKIVYLEATHDRLHQQNQAREAVVPQTAIDRMMDRWEVPDATEATRVEWWENGVRC